MDILFDLYDEKWYVKEIRVGLTLHIWYVHVYKRLLDPCLLKSTYGSKVDYKEKCIFKDSHISIM